MLLWLGCECVCVREEANNINKYECMKGWVCKFQEKKRWSGIDWYKLLRIFSLSVSLLFHSPLNWTGSKPCGRER